jgi:hypothetical protein
MSNASSHIPGVREGREAPDSDVYLIASREISRRCSASEKLPTSSARQ